MTSRIQILVRTLALFLAVTTIASVAAQAQMVRREFHTLTPAQLDSYKHGVEVMKARPAADPTSWSFQANMHGTDGPATDPLFNGCEHGTLHFFTWHRGYLYYFERILRKASGDPLLTLPYWDWSAEPVLPLAFRQPAGNANPLFDLRQINNGAMLPSQVVVNDRDAALAELAFEDISGALEGSPHGALHGLIGGSGDMSFISRSARDPIFWLHHANIDRLWNEWLNQAGRTNPADSAFLNRQFTYVDENSQRVTVRVRDIINSAQLGYRYDSVPNPTEHAPPLNLAALEAHEPATPADGAPHDEAPRHADAAAHGEAADHRAAPAGRLVATSRPIGGPESAAASKPLKLGFGKQKVALEFMETGSKATTEAIERSSQGQRDKIVLELHGLKCDAPPTFTYGVYLNLPEGAAHEQQLRQHYVRSLNFFGLADKTHQEHAAKPQELDITAAAARLKAAGTWDAKAITVTFVPLAPAAPASAQEDAQASQEAAAQRANITIDKLEVRVKSPGAEHAAPEKPGGGALSFMAFPKRVALPLPPAKRDGLEIAIGANVPLDPVEQVRILLERRKDLVHQLDLLDVEIARAEIHRAETLCGSTNDLQDVEKYDGSQGVGADFVKAQEPHVGQLQWVNDLPDRFSAPGDSPGDVNGVRWGSGGLISNDLFLTAGHCFDSDAGGWEMPQRAGVTISPGEIATLMKVNFGYQVDGTAGGIRHAKSFPVEALVEYRLNNLDYAVVRLGRNAAGQLPGEAFGVFNVAGQDQVSPHAMLCIIQHPNGLPKKIAAGPMLDNQLGRITYDNIDTLGGASGALILDAGGMVVGVHTNGGCSEIGGFNFGTAIGAIRATSQVVH